MSKPHYVRPDYKIAWWRKLRFEAIEAAGGICQRCYKEPATECHHLEYPVQRREQLRDLLPVCRFCHWELHDEGRKAANDNSPQLDLPLTGTGDD